MDFVTNFNQIVITKKTKPKNFLKKHNSEYRKFQN